MFKKIIFVSKVQLFSLIFFYVRYHFVREVLKEGLEDSNGWESCRYVDQDGDNVEDK